MIKHTHDIIESVYDDGSTKKRVVTIDEPVDPPIEPPVVVPPTGDYAPTPNAQTIELTDHTPADFWTELHAKAKNGPVNVSLPAGATVQWSNASGAKLPNNGNRIWIGCVDGEATAKTTDYSFVWYQDQPHRGPVCITNLDISPVDIGAPLTGIRMFNTDGLALYNVSLHDYGRNGISLLDNTVNTVLDNVHVYDIRSEGSYRHGIFAGGSAHNTTLRSVSLDRNGVMDANGDTVSLSRLMRAHNLYISPNTEGFEIDGLVSTRSAGVGAKLQAKTFSVRNAVFSHNPIGLGSGLDPSKPQTDGVTGTMDRVAVIDGIGYAESNRSQGVGFNGSKDVAATGLVVARCRQPLHITTEYTNSQGGVVQIDGLSISDSTFRGRLLIYSSGTKYDGVTLRGNRFQHADVVTAGQELAYFQHADPAAATFDGNEWQGPLSMDFVTNGNAIVREKFAAFKARVGETGDWIERPAANPDAGLESFGVTFDDVRAGTVNAADLYNHIAEGLR